MLFCYVFLFFVITHFTVGPCLFIARKWQNGKGQKMERLLSCYALDSIWWPLHVNYVNCLLRAFCQCYVLLLAFFFWIFGAKTKLLRVVCCLSILYADVQCAWNRAGSKCYRCYHNNVAISNSIDLASINRSMGWKM